jgi:AcrR family transcriptional regulator
MTESVAEKGYARATVADVLKRVHVSRETFYQHFSDKADCFLAAYEQAASILEAGVRQALGPEDLPGMERFERALGAYLELMAAEPVLAKTFLIEIYAAGPDAAQRRFELQQQWLGLFTGLLMSDEGWKTLPDPEFAARLVLGGAGSMVTSHITAGDHAALPGLRQPILALVRSMVRPEYCAEPGAGTRRSSGSL